MKRRCKIVNCTGLLVTIMSLFVGIRLTYGSLVAEKDKLCFDFKQCSILDALDEISRVTGIQIFVNRDMDKTLINKSYIDKTVGQIVNDLFRYQNRIIAIYPKQNGADILKIWVLGKGGGRNKYTPERLLGASDADVAGASDAKRRNSVSEKNRLERIEEQYPSLPKRTTRSLSTGLVKSGEAGSISMDARSTSIGVVHILPAAPGPEKIPGLEAPPMPPGFY